MEPRKIYKITRPGVRMTCAEPLPRAVAERWLQEHGDWTSLQQAQGAERAPAPHILALPLETGDAMIKTEEVPFGRSLRYALCGRPARAHQAFRLGLALASRGVRSTLPLALIEHRQQGLVRRSFLVLETIHASTLREFLLARLAALDGAEHPRFKGAVWRALGDEVAKLHGASFRQRDLKSPNILAGLAEDGSVRVHLIDLEGMSPLRGPPVERVRVRDLARLVVSLRQRDLAAAGVDADDRRELIVRYLESARGAPAEPSEVARVVAQTARWARRKERRNRRRGRPLL